MGKTKKTKTPMEVALDKKFKNLNDGFEKVQNELSEARAKGATKKEINKITKRIKKQGLAMQSFIESQTKQQVETVLSQLKSFIVENKEALEEIAKSKSGIIEFIPKAPETITTGSGVDVETPQPNINTSLSNVSLRNDNSMLSLMNVGSTGSAQSPYTEVVPKDGNYAFVAEGTSKPAIDFKWENRYPGPKKIAAYEVLTEEAVTDVVRLMSVAKDFLRQKHDLFKVDACFFAAGTGELPTGATVYGRTFTAGALALRVESPNFMDVVNAIVTDVYTTQNYTDETHYIPNIALVSPTDFFVELVSAKDDNGLPLYPQAGLFNTVTIGGITIKPWIKIPDGKIFVADMKKYNVINYIPFSIRIGWVNDDFIKNQFTMIGESRFFQYVKNLDQSAFVYDDIETVKTAITKI